MNLAFNYAITNNYHSNSQKARIVTETWVKENMFCPRCGRLHIERFPNNRPVADFYCPECHSEYELKSKNGKINRKVDDGAYDTMIERITSTNNPDFLFMGYSKAELRVTDFVFVPKHFFVPDIIEKRKPLSATARRTGWVGCNILLDKIPEQGRVEIVSHGIVHDVFEVVSKVNRSCALETNDINARSWLMDVLKCVNQIQTDVFLLRDVYAFSDLLARKHPRNNNIQAKIRQQLQILRDKGFIKFMGHGVYRKVVK